MLSIKVTPLVGVWIETEVAPMLYFAHIVTPLVGVWIETAPSPWTWIAASGHSPRGSVD